MNDTDTISPVISTEAEWRNLTPHGTGSIAAGVLSAQSLESPDLSPIPAGFSARDDLWAYILPSENRYGKKGCEEMICMSSRSFFGGRNSMGLRSDGTLWKFPAHLVTSMPLGHKFL
ncbi:hypothetical protein [Dialister succinatiphilus]|uniref:hypothetical protein n=1 Tax=Dialister succinatiphilus TaxID=487173 RepID=UPI0016526D3A|nr:hypothetical protein [Dialister succinatiphilus]